MPDTNEAAIRTELVQAHEMTIAARKRRQDAVLAARTAGWTKYKIASALGVRAPTVNAIIKAAEKEQQP